MLRVKTGDKVRVRDVLKSREWFAVVITTGPDMVITKDETSFIDRFNLNGWNVSCTRRIVDRVD